MANKLKRRGEKLAKEFSLGVLLAIIAFFVSISANGLFSIIHGSDNLKIDVLIFLSFGFVTIFLSDLLWFGFKNLEIVKKSSELVFVREYLKSKRRHSKK